MFDTISYIYHKPFSLLFDDRCRLEYIFNIKTYKKVV